MSDQLQAIPVTDYRDLINHWPLFMEGLEELNGTVKQRPVSPEKFFCVHLDIVAGKVPGVVFRVTSKNDKPLGFITALDDSSRYRDELSVLVYAIYSNNKSQAMPRFAFAQVETWAKERGYNEIHALSARTSGASIRWCKFKFGLSLSKLFFSKRL